MIKKIVIAVAVIVAAILIYAAIQPDSFRVERSASIKASPEKIFPLINDLHRWEAWSPWERVDPAIKRTYGGAESGVGAVYEWSGNREIGQGRVEIIESLPPSRVVLKIDFITPVEAHNTVEFTIVEQGDSTEVTQAMYGPSPYLSRLIGLCFSMDNMIGQKYEEGLAGMKSIAEK
jgi:hypothetical protein